MSPVVSHLRFHRFIWLKRKRQISSGVPSACSSAARCKEKQRGDEEQQHRLVHINSDPRHSAIAASQFRSDESQRRSGHGHREEKTLQRFGATGSPKHGPREIHYDDLNNGADAAQHHGDHAEGAARAARFDARSVLQRAQIVLSALLRQSPTPLVKNPPSTIIVSPLV